MTASPSSSGAVEPATTTDPAADEREVFRRDGVVRWDHVLTPGQVADLRVSVERAFFDDGRPAEGVRDLSERRGRPLDLALLQKVNLWRSDEACEAQVRRTDLYRRVEALLGGPVRLFRDHSFYKPAGKGERSRLVLHQDNRYWHLSPPEAVTVWMALDDATPENGCVQYVLGSHRWGRVEHTRPEEGAVLVEARSEREPVEYPVPAGSALVHHANTLHGSGPNLTDGPRRAYALVFVRADVSARGEAMTGVPLAADLAR
ncbi:phytanoyl-CoA dioxygenase family protein [[Kitasatospora] papulosa]|uniref:Phytanoyl-CoA dioxygenase family protein n=1 Tax=[Kitasatospora] papulosa TaxID=1464011 RepID=A0ABZ1KC72_9ACTN|nr:MULTISPECIES: phytanoyl-CoA dioxygenase family protein [Streptomyces]MBD2835006.1 phytanoyl-CoA dioxygenase family protein [Streptomyces pratensis]RAS34697.1 2-oxoglutarate-dependent dioxygenase [Streptomyces avidinii]TPN00056.1 phytanoyl-CoA dioxygenase family protein [Mesorhizobium sp. B2-3-3]AGJ59293.1 putative dioxygenase [Streptomyces sp. PAMC 26508]MCX4416309.1 phytanoyl-CoA dioxygenase family protein [[Kitasatospora] papulosa]